MATLPADPEHLTPSRTPPESLSDYAIRSLREDLIEGRLVPGQRIAMEVLAVDMGISHVPIREAVRYLEAEGHLQRDPRSQIRVTPVSPEEAAEIYRLREILEAEAHAAGVPRLTHADIAELDRHVDAMHAAVATGDLAGFARANRAFHFVPFRRAGSTWMLRFMNIVWDAAARYQTSLFQREGWESDLQSHHARLRDAMARRDPDEVNRIMDEHRRITIDAIGSIPATSEEESE
jgi:DNA-binding GntR family transcriptional regulator